MSSRRRREIERKKEESSITLRPEERKRRKIIGYEAFLFPDPALYDFIQWAHRVRSWVASVCNWLTKIEEVWRKHNMDIVVCFLQRLQWLDKATFPVEKRDAASGLVEPLAQHNVKNESNPYSIPPIAPPEDHLPPFKHTSADLLHQIHCHHDRTTCSRRHHDATTAAAARRECAGSL